MEYKNAKDNGKNVGSFYCLQPIIIKRLQKLDNDKELCYEVVDGQQRLITISILLQVFGYNKSKFRVSFERDLDSMEREEFLNDVGNIVETTFEKADFHFIYNAFFEANNWLNYTGNQLGTMSLDDDMRNILMKDTRVIWYELSDNVGGREVFRNINHGKLPLTNSELIKAMMLNSKHYTPSSGDADNRNKIVRIEQERMARLWDEIEETLQDEDFWAFISGGGSYSTRIDYIFELIFCQANPGIKIAPGAIFDYFETRIAETSDGATKRIDALWDDVRKYHRTFQDWYQNVPFYNYIGYLTHYSWPGARGITIIKKKYDEMTKGEFLSWLTKAIGDDVHMRNIQELTYSEDGKKIEKLLMLFNIETSNSMGRRFNFLVPGGWSVEHVFAQKSVKIQEKDRKGWIKKYLPIVKSALMSASEEELDPLMELEHTLIQYTDHEIGDFEMLFDTILKLIECKGVDVDSICNLALIGKDDNTSLGNSAFYEKRKKVINMMENGKNIPQATVNLFMKFYSGLGTNLDYWSVDDGNAYLLQLEHSLEKFSEQEVLA